MFLSDHRKSAVLHNFMASTVEVIEPPGSHWADFRLSQYPMVTLSHVLALSKLAMLRRDFLRQLEAAGIPCGHAGHADRGDFLMSADEHRQQAALFRRLGFRRFAMLQGQLARVVEHRLKHPWRP